MVTLALLGFSVLIFCLIMMQGAITPSRFGFAYGLGPRDEIKPESIISGRFRRTIQNHLEAALMFLPLAVLALINDLGGALINWGAGLFLLGRVGFSVCYLLGIPVVRSMFWGVSVTGLILIAIQIVPTLFR